MQPYGCFITVLADTSTSRNKFLPDRHQPVDNRFHL
jgi:hypothetical protein